MSHCPLKYQMLFYKIPVHSYDWNKTSYLKQNNSLIAYIWNQENQYGSNKVILLSL